MPARATRRDLLLGAVATLVMPNLPNPSEEPAQSEAERLLADARKSDADNVAARMKFPLPENSEPCFTFIPVERQVRKR